MNGNQQTALAEAADGDRLPLSTNRVRGQAPRPLPSQGRCLSPRWLLNLVSASPPRAVRNPAPGSRLRALGSRLAAPPHSAQRHRVQRGLLAVFLRGYQASPSSREPLAPSKQAGSAGGSPVPRCPVRPRGPRAGAGGGPQVGSCGEGDERLPPGPTSKASTQPLAEGGNPRRSQKAPVPRQGPGGAVIEGLRG